MIYTLHCNICLDDEICEFEYRDEVDEIEEDFNVISVDHKKKYVNHVCIECQNIIKAINPFHDYRHDMQCQIEQLRREVNASNETIRGSQIGLQNVYDLFKKLTDEAFISNFNSKIHELKDELRSMKKQIYESEQFVKKSMKKIGTINDLYTLSKVDPLLIKKLANVVNVLHYDDE
jgi:predicted RNase H-like nuclease (RuvC/YqgF family)